MLALVAGAIAAIGFGSRGWWISDTLANLRIHSVAALLVLLAAYWYRRHPRSTSATVIFLAGVLLLAPFGDAEIGKTEEGTQSDEFVVVSYNLKSGLKDFQKSRDFLLSTPADMLILQEYSFDWHERLQQLSEQFPYAVTEPRDGYFGIALFSRHSLSKQAAMQFPGSQIPFIQATVTFANQDIDVLGLHLQWPMIPSSFAERNRQIGYIIDRAAKGDRRLIACGDWNLTPWSGWYRQLIDAGLSNGTETVRFFPTWPAKLGWLGIPIDHCLTAGNLKASRKQIGPSIGSDHRPISVAFDIAAGDRLSASQDQ